MHNASIGRLKNVKMQWSDKLLVGTTGWSTKDKALDTKCCRWFRETLSVSRVFCHGFSSVAMSRGKCFLDKKHKYRVGLTQKARVGLVIRFDKFKWNKKTENVLLFTKVSECVKGINGQARVPKVMDVGLMILPCHCKYLCKASSNFKVSLSKANE